MEKCSHTPTALHVWGVYEIAGIRRDTPMHEALLCDACGLELWENSKDSVAALRMHYEVRSLPAEDYYPEDAVLDAQNERREEAARRRQEAAEEFEFERDSGARE